MAARKSKQIDLRNIIIAALVLVVGVETYFLYQSNPGFREFFVRDAKSPAVPKKAVKKKPVQVPSEELMAPAAVQKPTPVPAVSVKPQRKMPAVKAHVAIVIDDWGYSTKNCEYLRSIKNPITVAVLPDLPHSNDVMQCAHEAGKEIMLHLPMEAHNNSDEYPADYLLKTNMSPLKIDRLLTNILDKMPFVVGVNNHMGSKATEDKTVMTTVFKQLKYRGLFFMDSRVTSKSVCASLAKQAGLPFASRDVFLDNINERGPIEESLAELARIALKRGKALAIGHDRSLTLQVIEDKIPWFREQGIELVTVKDYIRLK